MCRWVCVCSLFPGKRISFFLIYNGPGLRFFFFFFKFIALSYFLHSQKYTHVYEKIHIYII